MKNVFIFFPVFFLLSISQLTAQEVICHFDRPYYVPGQYIYYHMHTGSELTDSFIMSVNLHNGKFTFDQHFLMIIKGVGQGYFQLPFESTAGTYYFQADVFSANAEPINMMITPLTILADDPIADQIYSIATESSTDISDDSKILIEINPVAESRQKIDCRIRISDGRAGDFISISVRDKKLYNSGNTLRYRENINLKLPLLSYIPIVGKRTITNQRPNPKAFLFVAQAEELQFRFNWVNDDQLFFIRMTPFYGKKPLYFIDNGGNDIEISLTALTPLQSPDVNLISDPDLKYGIETNLGRKKVYELFSQVEETVLLDPPLSLPNRIQPDYDIDVQDYAVRGTLDDLLKEIITPFKFRKESDDTYRVKVLYEVLDLKYFYDSDPLFFVNGMATRDYTFIANLPIQDIKRFQIYARLQTIRDLKLVDIGGVGVIEMVDPLFSLSADQILPSVEMQGLQIPLSYPVQADIKSKIPQLKSLLYWMPSAQLDHNGEYIFSIPASDDVSTFEIEVVQGDRKLVGRKEFDIRYPSSQN